MTTQAVEDDGKPIRRRDPLARAIALISHMVDSDFEEFGVRQLASAMSNSASTTHRLLSDLEGLGLVSRTPAGGYQLGLGFFRLATRGAEKFSIRSLVYEPLRVLSRRVDETSFFALYDEVTRSMTFAATEESTKPLRYVVELNERLPLHSGASGLAILASLSTDVQDEVVDGRPLPAVTDRTIVDVEHLRERLDEIRNRGYALSKGERIRGALAVAAPVFGRGSSVIGSIGITMPEANFDPGEAPNLASAVTDAAAELSACLQQKPAWAGR